MGRRVKNEGAKKTIDIVSYALKVNVNGVTCVSACSPFQVKITFKVCELA